MTPYVNTRLKHAGYLEILRGTADDPLCILYRRPTRKQVMDWMGRMLKEATDLGFRVRKAELWSEPISIAEPIFYWPEPLTWTGDTQKRSAAYWPQ